MTEQTSPPSLSPLQIFWRFLRFGLLAWGGPVAQIAMIRRELVDEEAWVSSAHFNRMLAIYQVLPGPEAHELCVHLGMVAGRRLGGLLAGLGFMLPGFVLMLALSWLYFHLDITQAAGAAFLGVQVGVIALIVRAVHRIGEHVLEDGCLCAIGLGAAAASLAGTSFWIVLPAGGALYALRRHFIGAAAVAAGALLAGFLASDGSPLWSGHLAASQPLVGAGTVSALVLFLAGLKAGLLTFGGAYTAIPFLRGDAVGNGWMTDGQFLDGLALSGVLPAPLIIFSTFVGYFAGGPAGAVAMTAGIFLPAFAFSLLFFDRLEAVVENARLHTVLEGVVAAVVGLIAATTLELASVVALRVPSLIIAGLIFTCGLTILYFWKSKLNIAVVILGSGLMGYAVFA